MSNIDKIAAREKKDFLFQQMIKIFSILVFLTTLDKKFGSSVSFSSEDAAPTVNLSTKKLKLVVNVSDKKKIEKNLMSQV